MERSAPRRLPGAAAALRLVPLLATLAIGCPPGGNGTDAGGGDPVWQAVHTDLDDFVLSAWGTGPTDLFFVGGNGVEGRGLLLQFNGKTWLRTLGVSTEVLWWVWGTTARDVWAVGEEGTTIHFDGTLWAPVTTCAEKGTVFWGVWGSASDAVWAVGGSLSPAGPKDVFLFWNGDRWLEAQPDVPSGENIFKVWGTAQDDIWAVGTGGVIYHWDGMQWRLQTSPTVEDLFTLSGTGPDDIWAVGGTASGVLIHYDGTGWSTVDEGFSPLGLNGVFAAAGSSPIVVGMSGYAARHRAGNAEELATGVSQGLHAVFGDGAGSWAVGGNLLGAGTGPGGVILHFGLEVPDDAIEDFAPPKLPPLDGCGMGSVCPVPKGSALAGDECPTLRACECEIGTECWPILIAKPYHAVCTEPCATSIQCQAVYGAGACCLIPGPQTVTSVCHPAGDAHCP